MAAPISQLPTTQEVYTQTSIEEFGAPTAVETTGKTHELCNKKLAKDREKIGKLQKALRKRRRQGKDLPSSLNEARDINQKLAAAIRELQEENARLVELKEAAETRAEGLEMELASRVRVERSGRGDVATTSSATKQVTDPFSYDQYADQKYSVVLGQYQSLLAKKFTPDAMDIGNHPNNTMLVNLKEVFLCVQRCYPTSRENYQRLVVALRAVINSDEYAALENESLYKQFVQELCIIRWRDTNLSKYLEESVQRSVNGDAPELTATNLPENVRETNEKVENSNLRKGIAPLTYQRLLGATGLSDHCGAMNPPHMRNKQIFQDGEHELYTIIHTRHGSPTAPGKQCGALEKGWRAVGAAVVSVWNKAAPKKLSVPDTTEKVTVDYKEYLKALEQRGESTLLCVYQNRVTESTRVKGLEKLQEDHENVFVLTQPVEGDLFEHKGDYGRMSTFQELKVSLVQEFFDTTPDHSATCATLPKRLRESEEYRKDFLTQLNAVHQIFFPDEEEVVAVSASDIPLETQLTSLYEACRLEIQEALSAADLSSLELTEECDVPDEMLTKILNDNTFMESFRTRVADENLVPVIKHFIHKHLKNYPKIQRLEKADAEKISKWQSYILLFYTFQKMDLQARLDNVNGFKLTTCEPQCKDSIDRSGNMAFVQDRLIHYLLGQQGDPRRLQEVLFNLFGPAFLVRKTGVLPYRIEPGLEVEKLLSKMSEEQLELLRNYEFGGRKVVDLQNQRVEVQSATPSVRENIAKEIQLLEANEGKDLVSEFASILEKYAGFDPMQWEEFSTTEGEALYLEEGEFNEARLREQIEKDLSRDEGVQVELSLDEGSITEFTYEKLKAELLRHPLIDGDEQKALKTLVFLQQQIGAEANLSINESLRNGHVQTYLNFNARGKIRCYKLELGNPHEIELSFSDTCELSTTLPSRELKRLADLSVRAKVVYQQGEGNELESRGYSKWSVMKQEDAGQTTAWWTPFFTFKV